jgi:GGDEF domain-containing protein
MTILALTAFDAGAGLLLASRSEPVLLITATVAAVLVLVIGVVRVVRRNAGTPLLAETSPRSPVRVPAPSGVADGLHITSSVCQAFQVWLGQQEQHDELWAGFDQLARELITEHLGATRVRCYHVGPGCATLTPAAQHGPVAPASGPSARAGLLGHVATSGREYAADDPACGQLLEDLAAQHEERFAWVWPVRDGETTIGLVAVGPPRDPALFAPERRATVGALLSLFWQHVGCVERLRVVERTDRASGVLTRNDFFTLAEHGLKNSYQANEPVVLAVLALEGLRRLDDRGQWRLRDALIERLGRLIARRVRSDDLVGRFADDRFVVVLRRLDSSLGRLIVRKMLAEAHACIRGSATGLPVELQLRAGLAGSGFAQPGLESLLVSAFQAVEEARRQNVEILSDLEEPGAVHGGCSHAHGSEAAPPGGPEAAK